MSQSKKPEKDITNEILSLIDLESLSRDEQLDLLEKLNELDNRLKYNKINQIFPDSGPFNRSLYPKQVMFMEAGKKHKERALFGGNRAGKSVVGSYEVALHLTGLYPHWWKGKRFYGPISAVCLGRSHTSVRDVAQYLLCGSLYDWGTGMIPKHCLVDRRAKQGTPNGLSQVMVKHYTNGIEDGVSVCDFMSYEAGADVLQGTTRELTWEDEENPDPEIHSELVTRTATVDGISVLTFTPRKGLSAIVKSFLPNGRFPDNNISVVETEYGPVERYIQRIEWDDVPHLSEKAKSEMLASYMPHEKEARSKGYPSIGSGKIYQHLEQDFLVKPFHIPYYWPRVFTFDPGWNRCAALWAAIDPHSDTVYIYDEYYVGEQQRVAHAFAIMDRGKWIPGEIDPSSNQTREEGKQSFIEYRKLGLNIYPAKNEVDAGLMRVNQAFLKGRLKVFNTLTNFMNEYRLYSYGKDGKPAREQNDHLMDCLRYLYNGALRRAIPAPDEFDGVRINRDKTKKGKSPSDRDPITGC